MTSPCSPPLKPPISPPKTPVPQASSIPSPLLPPSPLDFLALPSPPWSQQTPVPPPPPLPPPPAATGPAPLHVFGLEKSQLLKEAFEKAGPVPKGREDVKRLLKLHKDRFRGDLRWILFCADLPSLIQEGPQCGLVALWMAGTLLSPPSGVPLERLIRVATERGYTAQGEMFSVADMGRLAQEVLGCQAKLLSGGLGGPNRDLVLQHLVTGHPLLIPTSYDEDFNHEPCQRKGHKAHWAGSCWVFRLCPVSATLRTLSCRACSTQCWARPANHHPCQRRAPRELSTCCPSRARVGTISCGTTTRWSLVLSSRLECGGVISAHSSLHFPARAWSSLAHHRVPCIVTHPGTRIAAQ
ncbi:actin maturation protease isoform X9 [Pan troglodytes]|uniref:actin maturation protease isoform X9 n=1 Tax=Pan troglodytes TaxID=9598 RepID=UPI0023F3B4AB|nr:actin maturation protease isoform X10 [Pan troglodytes]